MTLISSSLSLFLPLSLVSFGYFLSPSLILVPWNFSPACLMVRLGFWMHLSVFPCFPLMSPAKAPAHLTSDARPERNCMNLGPVA